MDFDVSNLSFQSSPSVQGGGLNMGQPSPSVQGGGLNMGQPSPIVQGEGLNMVQPSPGVQGGGLNMCNPGFLEHQIVGTVVRDGTEYTDINDSGTMQSIVNRQSSIVILI